jgi:hypothetical protein
MSTTRITGLENVTTFTCCLASVRPAGKKIKLGFIKSTVLGTLSLLNSKDPDPGYIYKSDPDA